MYFNNLENVYLTKVIGEFLDSKVIFTLLTSILESKKTQKVDYLQIFELELNKKNKSIKVTHTQEETENTHELKKEFTIKNIEKMDFIDYDTKIYIIDDITHKTILFASEY